MLGSLVDVALATEGAISYGELRDLPLSELHVVMMRIGRFMQKRRTATSRRQR